MYLYAMYELLLLIGRYLIYYIPYIYLRTNSHSAAVHVYKILLNKIAHNLLKNSNIVRNLSVNTDNVLICTFDNKSIIHSESYKNKRSYERKLMNVNFRCYALVDGHNKIRGRFF